GRVSPYFFNVGRFQTGAQITRLGEFMAEGVRAAAPKATLVFGPAYKGIPLCLSTAMALSRGGERDVGYLFDRKEVKTHGDAGRFVGQAPGPHDRIVLVDDVITDGATKHEAVAMLRETFTAPIDALVIAFNRMETDAAGEDAAARFEAATGIPVMPLLTVADLEAALSAGDAWDGQGTPPPGEVLEAIRDYRRRYGVGGAR
ncbi:MAG TPA: orotate phosphoribosyltransferase, partial [bacterium]